MKRSFDFYAWNDWRDDFEITWIALDFTTSGCPFTFALELGLLGVGFGFHWDQFCRKGGYCGGGDLCEDECGLDRDDLA